MGVGGVMFGEVFAGGTAFVDSLFEVFEFVLGVVVVGMFVEAWEYVTADGVEFGCAGMVGGVRFSSAQPLRLARWLLRFC